MIGKIIGIMALSSVSAFANPLCNANLYVDGVLTLNFQAPTCREALRDCSKHKAINYRNQNVDAKCIKEELPPPPPIDPPVDNTPDGPTQGEYDVDLEPGPIGTYMSESTLRKVEIYENSYGELLGSYKGQSSGTVRIGPSTMRFRSGSNDFTMRDQGPNCFSLSWRNLNTGRTTHNADVLCKAFLPSNQNTLKGSWFSFNTLRSVKIKRTRNEIIASYKGQSAGTLRILHGNTLTFTSGSNKFFMNLQDNKCASLSWINLNTARRSTNQDTLCQARKNPARTQVYQGLWSSFNTGRKVSISPEQNKMVASYKGQSAGTVFYLKRHNKIIFDSGSNRFFIDLETPRLECGSLSWINFNTARKTTNADRLCHMLDVLPQGFIDPARHYLSLNTLRVVDIYAENGGYTASYRGQSIGNVSFHPESLDAHFISGSNEFRLGMSPNGDCTNLSWRNLNTGRVSTSQDTLCGAETIRPSQSRNLRGMWYSQNTSRSVEIRKTRDGLSGSYKGQSAGFVHYLPQTNSLFFVSGSNRFELTDVGSSCMGLNWINLNTARSTRNQDSVCSY